MDIETMPTRDGKHLLIIDDEANMRHMLGSLLKHAGFIVDVAEDGAIGLDKVRRRRYRYVLCDIRMPKMDGMAFLRAARAHLADTTVIMMSAYGSMETAIEAMKLGAYDYISKPFKTDEVTLVLKKAEERESLKNENRRLRETIRSIEEEVSFGSMLGKSPAMGSVFRMAEKVARYDTTVLIGGASGTGKELMARGIHLASRRAEHPMVAVNCGGIPENLMESEMFGYKRGAFTGADRDKKGLFEAAHRGTIFLDEIGELPGALQVKLLRALQEREILPLGGSKPKTIDIRVIAATARDLETEVANGRFRQDLFYRLNVMPIRLPDLKDRMEDLPLLCRHFLQRLGLKLGKPLDGISPPAMSVLLSYAWPGNVRELKNVLERAAVLTESREIAPDHLPDGLAGPAETDSFSSLGATDSLKVARQALEREMIARVLKKTGGNRTHAAKRLEISHPSLLSKIKTYGLKP
jgi:two-component system, NtrC family, response regulator AtoC